MPTPAIEQFLSIFGSPEKFLTMYQQQKVYVDGEPDARIIHIPQSTVLGEALPELTLPRPPKEDVEAYLAERTQSLALTQADVDRIQNSEIPALNTLISAY